KRSIAVNLLGVPLADRPAFFAHLLPRLREVEARTGRPHWLVVDEAHHLLPAGKEAAAPPLPDRGATLITVHPGSAHPAALARVGTLLVIGDRPGATVAEFCAAAGEPAPSCPPVEGDKVPAGHAV